MKDGQRCGICRWIIRIRDGKEYAQVYAGGDVFKLRPHKCKQMQSARQAESVPGSESMRTETMNTIHVLSIQWPWAKFILWGSKRVENRAWRYLPQYRGELYIHVGKKADILYTLPSRVNIPKLQGMLSAQPIPKFEDVAGKIVGKVQVTGAAWEIDDPWYIPGNVAILLDAPVVLPRFVPYRGQLGIFRVPEEVLRYDP